MALLSNSVAESGFAGRLDAALLSNSVAESGFAGRLDATGELAGS